MIGNLYNHLLAMNTENSNTLTNHSITMSSGHCKQNLKL